MHFDDAPRDGQGQPVTGKRVGRSAAKEGREDRREVRIRGDSAELLRQIMQLMHAYAPAIAGVATPACAASASPIWGNVLLMRHR